MKKIISALILAIALCGVMVTAPAMAAECGGVETSINFGCPSSAKGAGAIESIMLMVINFAAVGVGIAVVGGIVYGGIRYTTANGNASSAQQGIMIIVNAVIGLVLFIMMYAIINFLVPGGVLR